jgi:ferredoxin
MKTTIYCFTGTGNSLKVARDIAAGLGDAEIVPMREPQPAPAAPSERVGIVFPVYMGGVPMIVGRFLDRLHEPGKYVFAVATYGGSPGSSLNEARRRLAAAGTSLGAGFGVRMPGNYTPFYDAYPKDRQEKLFAAEAGKVKAIVEAIVSGRTSPPESGNFIMNLLFSGIVHPISAPKIPASDGRFSSDAKCNGCGVCARVCPVGNITIEAGRPLWHHRCEQCLACLHWCPQTAIQSGSRTAGRRRYHHPDITLHDIMRQN